MHLSFLISSSFYARRVIDLCSGMRDERDMDNVMMNAIMAASDLKICRQSGHVYYAIYIVHAFINSVDLPPNWSIFCFYSNSYVIIIKTQLLTYLCLFQYIKR